MTTRDETIGNGPADARVGGLPGAWPHAVLLLALVALLVGFYGLVPLFGSHGTVSTLRWMWLSWNSENEMRHAVLIPLVSGYLIWKDRRKLAATPLDGRTYGLLVVVFAALLFLASARTIQARLAVASIPFALFGCVLTLGGPRWGRLLFFPIFLLLFTIPVPALQQATNHLQILATTIAYHVTSLMGIDVIQSGTVLKSASDAWTFEIDEGCSGIRSLMALTLIAAVYAYLSGLVLWKKVVIFACALPLAVLTNAIRITTIVLIAHWGYPKLAAGLYHDYAPFLIFPIALVCLIGIHTALTLPERTIVRRHVRRRSQGGGGTPSA